jgi:hypothetical protein
MCMRGGNYARVAELVCCKLQLLKPARDPIILFTCMTSAGQSRIVIAYPDRMSFLGRECIKY